jgi:hypothetical protein
MTSQLHLYFVAHCECGDINRDLVLWATSAQDAVCHWRAYFALQDDCEPFDLFECREAPRAGPVPWHHSNGFRLLSEETTKRQSSQQS